MLLSEVWNLYKLDKQTENYSIYTLQGYQIQMNLLTRYFGDIEINNIIITDLKQYIVEVSQHLKPSSVEHRTKFIKSFFRWAVDEGYIEKNPASVELMYC